MSGMTTIERRVLAYMDQRGPTHRSEIAADGLVANVRDREGFYRHHAITETGKRMLREVPA